MLNEALKYKNNHAILKYKRRKTNATSAQHMSKILGVHNNQID